MEFVIQNVAKAAQAKNPAPTQRLTGLRLFVRVADSLDSVCMEDPNRPDYHCIRTMESQ